jgi:hypothetical protein
MKRALTPTLNPTGIGSAIAAVYAGVVLIWNVTHHHAAIDPQVIIAAIGAAAFLYTRMKVTPVADPKDGNGQPLVAAARAITYVGGSGAGGGGGEYALKAAPAQKTLIAPAAPESDEPGAAGPVA